MVKKDKVWFKARHFGLGWRPVSWEEATVVILFVILVLWNFHRIDSQSHSASDTMINFIPQTVVLVALLIGVCWWKGERPRGWKAR